MVGGFFTSVFVLGVWMQIVQPLFAGQAVAVKGGAKVSIANFVFTPGEITIVPGETVTWDFDTGAGYHNVEAVSGPAEDPNWASFKSPPVVNSGKYTFTFTRPGTYAFKCGLHVAMSGAITVSKPEKT